MAKFHFVDPYTRPWWHLRLGVPTASQFHRIVTNTGKPSAQARGYMYELIAERLLRETYVGLRARGPWVEHGAMHEKDAIDLFQKTHRLVLKNVGFVTTNDGRIGASPDCLVEGSVEAVEIKCPAPWTQIGYLLDGPGDDYRPQVQGQLLVGEWDIIHCFTYHPRMPSCYIRTKRDPAFMGVMADLLDRFCDKLDQETERARALGGYIPLEDDDREIASPFAGRGI